MIHTDAVLMEQILVNLLDNAAKYAPPGSTLLIAATMQTPHRLRMAVEDKGPGVPPAERERVFDMFYRVNKGGRQIAGTGLGLAICRDLVKVLDGSITLGSGAGGRGARFEDGIPSAAETGDGTEMSIDHAKILIVDDEAPIRKFLRISLTAAGHHVIEAASAAAALQSLERDSLDLVLLDLGLPDADGQDVILAIRARSQVPLSFSRCAAAEPKK